MKATRHFAHGLAVAALLAAGACGGSGGDADAAQAPTASTVAASGSTGGTTTSSPSSAATATCGLANFQAQALAAVNAARSAGANCRSAGAFPPAPALTWSPQLAQASAAHTTDMVTNQFFSHTGSSGSTLGSRVTAAGYAWRAVAENIAAGYGTVDSVVAGWLASDGHCANLMSATYTQMGLACVSSPASGNNWTMDLAAPQ